MSEESISDFNWLAQAEGFIEKVSERYPDEFKRAHKVAAGNLLQRLDKEFRAGSYTISDEPVVTVGSHDDWNGSGPDPYREAYALPVYRVSFSPEFQYSDLYQTISRILMDSGMKMEVFVGAIDAGTLVKAALVISYKPLGHQFAGEDEFFKKARVMDHHPHFPLETIAVGYSRKTEEDNFDHSKSEGSKPNRRQCFYSSRGSGIIDPYPIADIAWEAMFVGPAVLVG